MNYITDHMVIKGEGKIKIMLISFPSTLMLSLSFEDSA